MKQVECFYYDKCASRTKGKCHKCKNNKKRNYEEDYFIEANDNPIPEQCPKLSYSGPAEQTAGYQCPVCGAFTSPYVIRDNICGSCGYGLNI